MKSLTISTSFRKVGFVGSNNLVDTIIRVNSGGAIFLALSYLVRASKSPVSSVAM